MVPVPVAVDVHNLTDASWSVGGPVTPSPKRGLYDARLATTGPEAPAPMAEKRMQPVIRTRNCSELWGSADYSASCGRAAKHGTSIANRSRPLKREQLPAHVAFISVGSYAESAVTLVVQHRGRSLLWSRKDGDTVSRLASTLGRSPTAL